MTLNIPAPVGALGLASLYAVGEDVLFGRTLAWSEPLTALPRSARSRVSSSRSLERPTRTPSPPYKASQQHARRRVRLVRSTRGEGCVSSVDYVDDAELRSPRSRAGHQQSRREQTASR